MYRGNLHRGAADAARHWPVPAPTLSASRFRRLLRSRSLAVSRLEGARKLDSGSSSPNSRLDEGAPEPVGQAEEVDGGQQQQDERQEEEEEEQAEGHDVQQQQQQEQAEGEGQDEQQQQGEHGGEEEEEQEEGAVEDVEMDDAGEVVAGGDHAGGNGDPEEGQGESEGFDPNAEVPNSEVSYRDGVEGKKRDLSDKLDTLNKKKHDLVQMLKQVLNAEEEIRTRSMQAPLRAAMPQQSENAADGSSVPRQAPRMTVDVNFSEFAGESDAGSNQGTPGRPLHHVHSISPSTASFARSPFSSLHHNSGHTPRSPATFSTASPSRFAASGHQGNPYSHPSASLPGSNFVASSPSPAASGGSSSVFRDYRPPNST